MLTEAPTWFPIVDEVLSQRCVAEAALEGEFTFNGETHNLGEILDWTRNPSGDIEWLILLHKFYYATALGSAWKETGDARYVRRWMSLTEQWIDSVPLDFLPSDVAGRRLQNWISAWYFFENAPQVTPRFRQRFFDCLSQQLNRLAQHLTPARNHRTLELLTLFYAGVAFPELREAQAWLELGRTGLASNIASDFRHDGVHCEQSTDYHHIVLRNALVARRLAEDNGISFGETFDHYLRRALEFALWVHRPDGTIPQFSDGDTGSFLPLLRHGYGLFGDEQYRWIESLGSEGKPPDSMQRSFFDGGYHVWRSGWGNTEPYRDERHLVFDCGPIGDGNHGHLDALSFELYGYGHPLVVDPGRYTYDEAGDPNWRVLFRGTSYHNTVTVDGLNQARYERVKQKHKIRGPHPAVELLWADENRFEGRVISPEYDATHTRTIRFLDGRRFLIIDELASASEHDYQLWFHLSPLAQGRLTSTGGNVATPNLHLSQFGEGTLSVVNGWVSPAYGIKEPAPILCYSARGRNVRFETMLEVNP